MKYALAILLLLLSACGNPCSDLCAPLYGHDNGTACVCIDESGDVTQIIPRCKE
jgi:hypothetical protein